MGGFECEPTAADGKPARTSAPGSEGSTPRESPPSTSPLHPHPQPPPLYQQTPADLSSASALPVIAAYPPPALSTLTSSPGFSSYPPAATFANPSTLAVAQPLGAAPPSPFSPFADLAYSAALLDFFTSIPPAMPAPGYYSPSTELSNSLLGFGAGGSAAGGLGGWPLGGSRNDLRSFIIKELSEGEDPGTMNGGADLTLTASICELLLGVGRGGAQGHEANSSSPDSRLRSRGGLAARL